jgi:Sec-independent protein translocase protein TatA
MGKAIKSFKQATSDDHAKTPDKIDDDNQKGNKTE